MFKKLIVLIAVISLFSALPYAETAQAADGINLLERGGFEEVTDGILTGYTGWNFGADLQLKGPEIDGAQEGFYYLEMPTTNCAIGVPSVGVNENTNYLFSFWTKSKLSQSNTRLEVNIYLYTSEDGGWESWRDYCTRKEIPIASAAEGALAFYAGGNSEQWQKNSFEFHVPHDATHAVITITPMGGTLLPGEYRYIDDIRVEQTEYNLIQNSSFDYTYSTISSSTTEYMSCSNWTFHPSDHFDGTCNVLQEANGNQFLYLKSCDHAGHDYKGTVLRQPVYLYPGYYKLSFKRINFTGTASFFSLTLMTQGITGSEGNFASTAKTTFGNRNRQILNKAITPLGEAPVQNGGPYPWGNYATFFEVKEADAFALHFGSIWGAGGFSVDEVSLVPVTEAEFTYYKSLEVYAAPGTTGVDGDSARIDIKYTPIDTAAGAEGTARLFGLVLPETEDAQNVRFFTTLYKKEGGDVSIAGISAASGTAGEGRLRHILGKAITIPAVQNGEVYTLNSFVWGEALKPFTGPIAP